MKSARTETSNTIQFQEKRATQLTFGFRFRFRFRFRIRFRDSDTIEIPYKGPNFLYNRHLSLSCASSTIPLTTTELATNASCG